MASGTGELNASAVGPRFDLSAFAAVGAGAIAIVYPVYLVLMFQTGNWILGTDGRPGVSDFLVFYLAGQLALKGAAASAYVPQLLHAAEAAVVGHGFSSQLPWRYAPLFLFVTAPLALLPYVSAFLLWIAGTLALFAGVVSRIARSPVGLILACASPAVFINGIGGQNGPLTAALVGAALLNLEDNPLASGICVALLSYKPQFGILFPLLFIAGGYWRALVTATLATLATVLASCAVFGVGSVAAFLHFLPITSNELLIHGANGFNKLETAYGIVRWLGFGNGTAWAVQAAVVAVTAAALVRLWRSDIPYAIKASAAAVATLIVTPHLYPYDFAILSVAFAFLYRERAFDPVELIAIAAAFVFIGAFLFFPTPICLLATAITVTLIVRRVHTLNPQAGTQAALAHS
jgi:arabinofuranan 3-O-arabinosyltransferase